jgi:hypothetical protein
MQLKTIEQLMSLLAGRESLQKIRLLAIEREWTQLIESLRQVEIDTANYRRHLRTCLVPGTYTRAQYAVVRATEAQYMHALAALSVEAESLKKLADEAWDQVARERSSMRCIVRKERKANEIARRIKHSRAELAERNEIDEILEVKGYVQARA